MATYAVLLAAGRLRERRAVARQVAEASGRPVLDALQALHHGCGIVAERLTAEQAQGLGATQARLGLGTFAVPDQALLAPVRPLRVTKATPTSEHLVIEDQLQRTLAEPWAELQLLCAGTVREVAPDAPAAVVALAEASAGLVTDSEESGRFRHVADLVFGAVAPRHYRLEAAACSYPYLAAAGRLALRHEENWIAFLADLVAAAPPGAWLTAAARAMAAGRLAADTVVDEVRLYDAEVRWRMQRLLVLGAGND